jgi:hypothetical protein
MAMVLNNKHLVTALLVAPVLSILAWFAVGRLAGEQPHAAVPGQVYPLLERSNCRYPSGRCDMVNGDFELGLELRDSGQAPLLELHSSVRLQGVLLAVVPPELIAGQPGPAPTAMRSVDNSGTLWRLPIESSLPEGARLRLVAATDDNRFTADVAARFAGDEG